ncbi:MAG: hypothetical protein JW395_1713 [Nitrospira sp.]|nr:hypothetical protein [Nitrospira sp.]
MLSLEFFKDPLRLFDTHAALDRVVVVEGQIPFGVLIGSHAPLLRVLRHRIMPAEIEGAEPQRMHMVFVRFEKFHRGPGLFLRFAGKAKEAHAMVPDADVGRHLQVLRDHLRRRRLIHQLQHPLVPRLVAEVEIAAARVLRILPDLIVQQTFLEPHVRGPDNAHLAVDQPARQLTEQGRRIGLVGEVEMPRPVLVTEIGDVCQNVLNLLRPVAGRIAFAMLAELAAAPITTPRRQIGQELCRHEVFMERQAVEIRRRQGRHVLRKAGGRHMYAGGVLIYGVGYVSQTPLRPHRRDQLHKGRLPFIDHSAVEQLE